MTVALGMVFRIGTSMLRVMKRITSIFSIAVAAMAMLASCSKSEVKNDNLLSNARVYTAYSDASTKTAMDGFSTKWLPDDTIWGVDMTPAEHVSNPPSFDGEDGHKVSFTFPGLENDLFLAIYPSAAAAFDMQDYAYAYATIPSEQTAVKDGFSNGAAVSIAYPEEGSSELHFMNLVSFVGVRIQNENIVKVELEDIDAVQPSQLTGKFSINPWDGPSTSMTGCEYPATSTKVSLSGTFEKDGLYYFCVAPREGGHGLYDIRLTFTDKNGRVASFEQHSETDPKVTFKRNQTLIIFDQEIPDSKWQGAPSSEYFVKVTAAPESWDGDYLIVYDNKYAMNTHSGNQNANTFATYQDISEYYDSENNSFAVNSTTEALVYTAEATDKGYSLYCVSDQSYLGITTGTTSTGSRLRWNTQYSESACDWTLSVGSIRNVGSNTLYIRWNNNSGSERFAAYAETGQKAITLFKRNSAGPVVTKYDVVCATVANGTISASPVRAAEGATVTLTATPDSGYEFDSWNVTGATVADATSATTTFTMPAANVNVSATFKEKEVESLKTMDEIFAAATAAGSTATDAKVTFNNWVISGVKNNNAYLTDNNGKGLIIYTSGHGFVVGDILSGTVNCKVQLYNGASELTALTSTTEGLTVTKGGVATPQTISIATLGGVNTGAVLTFDELTYNGSIFSDGTNTITPYNTFITLPALVSGKKYSVKGVYIQYRETKEIAPRTADDIVEKAAPKYNVTVASGITNGTVTVDYSEATEGQTVTITATPAEGYKVKSVSAKKTASGDEITVTHNKFTMPAEAVTVSAEFEDASGSTEYEVSYTLTSADLSQSIDDNVSLTFNANGGTAPAWYNPEVRTYEKNITTLTCDGGLITSIVFTYSISNYGSLTASTGTYTASSKTWEGSAETVSFTTGHSSGTKNGQVRISKIVVKYTK